MSVAFSIDDPPCHRPPSLIVSQYEGMIERRRAPEFEAMSLAGEDSDEDDDTPSRKASSSKTAAKRGSGALPPAPVKSLKGKETFKARNGGRGDLTRASSSTSGGRRRRMTETEDKKDGVLSEVSSPQRSEDANEGPSRTEHQVAAARADDRRRESNIASTSSRHHDIAVRSVNGRVD